jgi:hypothetical protein
MGLPVMLFHAVKNNSKFHSKNADRMNIFFSFIFSICWFLGHGIVKIFCENMDRKEE